MRPVRKDHRQLDIPCRPRDSLEEYGHELRGLRRDQRLRTLATHVAHGLQEMHLKLTVIESGGELTVIENVLESEFEFTCGDNIVRGGPGTFVHSPRGARWPKPRPCCNASD
jgi:hypothetical protein